MEAVSLREEIRANQKKRLETGKIVFYKDNEDYFQAPSFTTVKVSALKSYLKQYGINAF